MKNCLIYITMFLSIKEAAENYSSRTKKIKVLAKNHGYFNSVLPEKICVR